MRQIRINTDNKFLIELVDMLGPKRAIESLARYIEKGSTGNKIVDDYLSRNKAEYIKDIIDDLNNIRKRGEGCGIDTAISELILDIELLAGLKPGTILEAYKG